MGHLQLGADRIHRLAWSGLATSGLTLALALGHALAGEHLSAESLLYAGAALAGVALLVTTKSG